MFLKRIFSRPPPPKPATENFSMDSLRDRISKIKTERMETFKPKFSALMDEINKVRAALSESLKGLYSSEPEEEIHPGLMKSATEARKLLFDKVSRAISDIGRHPELTSDALSAFDERLSKAVNLTTDAMKTHVRYVRAAFEQKSSEFESHLRELHELAMRAHTSIVEAMKDIQGLDSILSEILLNEKTMQDLNKLNDDIKSLESRAKGIEDSLKDESARLTELKTSEEFKRATDSLKEFRQTEQEISRVRGTAVSRISEMSRPFRKLEKLVKSGGHSIESDTSRILEICINNPIDVISSEENISAFEKLLRETSELASAGKIDLDKRERKNTLDSAQRLVAELGSIKNNLANLDKHAEAQKRASGSPIIGQTVKLENLMKHHEYDLGEVRSSIEELGKKSKLMQEELVSRRESVKKKASDAIGVAVELSS